MASITSNVVTGNWSATSSWVGAVVPVLGDKVTIASGAVITLDGVYSAGDDTTTGVIVNGTLAASRLVNSGLTVRGTLTCSTTTGKFDFGTQASSIPLGVTFTMVLNDSASMANNKYQQALQPAEFHAWGAAKTPVSQITSLISQSSFVVADATGWQVGDWVFASATTIGTATTEARAISTITPGAGTTATIVLTAALTNTNFVGRYIANVSRNVKWTYSNPASFQSSTTVIAPSTAAAGSYEVGYMEVQGGRSIFNAPGFGLSIPSYTQMKKVIGISGHDVCAISGSTVTTTILVASTFNGYILTFAGRTPGYFENVTICHINPAVGFVSNGEYRLKNPVSLGSSIHITSINALGPAAGGEVINPTFVGGAVWGAIAAPISSSLVITGGVIDGVNVFTSGSSLSCPNLTIRGTTIGKVLGIGSPSTIINYQSVASVTFDGCTVPAGVTQLRSSQSWNATNGLDFFKSAFLSKNNDPLYQEAVLAQGKQFRNNYATTTDAYRGTSSMRLDPWYAGAALTYSTNVSLAANQTAVFIGATRWNTDYGSGTPPKVDIAGGGITPVSYTNGAAVNTWEPYSLTVVNPNSYPITVTITYTAQTTANLDTASAYFDGVYDAPWVTSTRHFGYQFLPQSYVTADSRITITEAAALALGVTVNHTLHTITFAGTLTNAQVFQACMADLCQTANQAVAVHISSTDGANFTTSYTVSGTVNGSYTDASGVHTSIAVTGIITGSRVQVYNVSTSTELYNGVPGTSLALSALWTTNQTLRLRVARTNGTSAYLPIEQTGLLASSGANFLVSQVADTVYNTLAIDGSTCTEFTADIPNLQVDVTDPDGVTTVQRVYAWGCYNQTTSGGIASMFNAITATDTANFLINTAVVNAKLDNLNSTPVIMAGGYLSRSDGTTVIAATSGSIQLDPGKAYIAPGSLVNANIVQVAGTTIHGSGTADLPWGP